MKSGLSAAIALILALLIPPAFANAGVCEYADTTYAKVTTGIAGVGVATGAGLNIAGVTALTHSSGAAIAAISSSGYLAGTLGAVGTVTGFITAPVTLVVGGVAVVAAGGAIAYCLYNKGDQNVAEARANSAPKKVK